MADDPGVIPSAGLQAPGTQGMLMPGSRIAGYLIEEQVGAGGMAVVYRARDEVLGRAVAVKVLSPALASDQEFRTRFLRESRAVAAVDESHIVPVYGAGDDGGVLYIASRFVAGGDLSRVQRTAAGPLPPLQVVDVISQVASALDAAHAIGLVHRDVKPGNILIEQIPGRPDHAYLSDFGLSKSATDATGLTAIGRFMGTPDYCAPEQITGAAIDGRADQYSLACVAFSLLAGVVPFGRGDSMARLFAHVNSPVPALTSIRPGLPSAVDGVLARGMAKNPVERYGSCAAFASALRGALGIGTGTFPGAALPTPPQDLATPGTFGFEQTVTAGASRHPSLPPGPGGWPPPGPGRRQRSPRRRSRLIGGVAAAAVVVAGVVVGVTLSSRTDSTGNAVGVRSPSGATTPAAARTSPSASSSPVAPADHTGTAVLVGSLTAPGGSLMKNAFFSPDGTYIAAVSTKADIYIFSAETLTLVTTVSVGAGEVAYPISFSSDDKTLYAVGWTSTYTKMYGLNVASGKATVYSMPAVTETWNFIGGPMIGTFASTGPVSEYNASTGKVHAQVPNPGKSAVASAGPDADGNYILISDTDGTAYLVDTRSKQVVGTFHYPYKGSGSIYPELTPDGNTVYVPGGSTAAARLWDRTTQSYVTPAGSRWPNPDTQLLFSTDSKFVLTSPTSVSETVDIWNIATRAHVITLTVPGGANEADLSIGPAGSELLSTVSLDIAKGTFPKLNVWTIPG